MFIILQIFFAVRAVLKIGECFSDIQSPVLARERDIIRTVNL